MVSAVPCNLTEEVHLVNYTRGREVILQFGSHVSTDARSGNQTGSLACQILLTSLTSYVSYDFEGWERG